MVQSSPIGVHHAGQAVFRVVDHPAHQAVGRQEVSVGIVGVATGGNAIVSRADGKPRRRASRVQAAVVHAPHVAVAS